jgi:Coenzyme PQQ synthesis protein D (PqqD)
MVEPHSQSLSVSSLVVRSNTFIDSEIANEIVALNIERGTCYGLNRVGSRIWKLLAAPVQISELCKILVHEYNVDLSVCETQIIDFLEELRSEGLITSSQTP